MRRSGRLALVTQHGGTATTVLFLASNCDHRRNFKSDNILMKADAAYSDFEDIPLCNRRGEAVQIRAFQRDVVS
jgi:hypothetical protein